MAPAIRCLVVRYAVAVGAVLAALGLRLALDPWLGPERLELLLFCLAVVAVAWHGGFGPSMLATLLSVLAVGYFIMPPRQALVASLTENWFRLFGFVFLCVTVSVFSEALRRARQRAEAHARNLEKEVGRRRLLEQELQAHAQQLAEADRRKDEFLATLGHELRNPLAPIRNALDIMRLGAASEQQRGWARDVIERQLQHLTRLVDDLLDLSRISRGKITLNRERVQLSTILERAVESSRPLFEARRHELTITLPPEPIWLQADPTRLAQVFANLLNNAAKYTPEGGKIQVGAERAGADIEVRVRDNGVGILPEMLPRVFEPFAQADETRHRSEGGLGIGLALVKRLLEVHGGNITGSSGGPGKGSEFVARLPLAHAEPSPGVPAAPAVVEPLPAGRRILAVDDNVDAVESLAMLLGARGHQVRTAYDGPAALAVAADFRPEVVLLDIGLPQMNGYEVARRLREQPALQQTMLVAITGYGQEEDRRRADEAGFDAHVIKPADPDVLQRLLAEPTQP